MKIKIKQVKGDVTLDDSQRPFLAQHSFAMLFRHCFECLQHCSNIAMMCCAKNRRVESSGVRSPLAAVHGVMWVLFNVFSVIC